MEKRNFFAGGLNEISVPAVRFDCPSSQCWSGLGGGQVFFDRILFLPSRRDQAYTIGDVPIYVQEF
jgi:hypothetical protein